MLKRAGHTEATIDLVTAAGLYPAGVLCELVSEDKTRMARLPELEQFAETHGMLPHHHRGPDPVPASQGQARPLHRRAGAHPHRVR